MGSFHGPCVSDAGPESETRRVGGDEQGVGADGRCVSVDVSAPERQPGDPTLTRLSRDAAPCPGHAIFGSVYATDGGTRHRRRRITDGPASRGADWRPPPPGQSEVTFPTGVTPRSPPRPSFFLHSIPIVHKGAPSRARVLMSSSML